MEAKMMEAKSKKRGKGITLICRALEGTNASKEELAECYMLIASENQGLRTAKDVKDWMTENNYIGTVYPVRMGKPITRAEQKKIMFS